jgi:hypothetical protein
MLTAVPEAGVRMLRSAATPSPRKKIIMTEITTDSKPTGTAGRLPLRCLYHPQPAISLRLI